MPIGGGIGIGTLIAGGLADIGITGTAAAIGTGALEGAAGGALLSGVTGGNPLIGAATGAITGGFVPAGGALGGEIGGSTGAAIGDVLGGAAGGALGSQISGGSPVTGALTGAVPGVIAGVSGLSSGAPSDFGSPAAPAGGASAASAAPPAGAAPLDLTSLAGGVPFTTASPASVDPSILPAAGGSGVLSAPSPGLPSSSSLLDFGGGSLAGTPTITGPNAVGPESVAGGTAAGSGAGSSGILGSPGSLLNKISSPGTLVAGGGLLYSLLKGNKVPDLSNLQNQADTLGAQGTQLGSYLQSGTLPPGAQTAINQATAAAKAKVRSQYAAMGMSGSSAETQDLNNIDLQAQTQAFGIADQLLQTGINESGLASGIYENLVAINQKQAQQTGSAIANLAAALSGGGNILGHNVIA